MKLHKENLRALKKLAEEYKLPEYDIEAIKIASLENPVWLHLGAGNIFRGFLGACQQKLLNTGVEKTGIIVAEGYDYEIVDILSQYDNLTVNVTLKESGAVEKEVLGSIVDYLKMDSEEEDFIKIKNIFKAPSLKMVSLTITEKGYQLTDNQGKFQKLVSEDFEKGPDMANSYLGKLTSLLVLRFKAGAEPLALVSMDNMAHNGEKLRQSIVRFVEEWQVRGYVSDEFADYIKQGDKVSFPWSMIDKITPRPDCTVQKMLEETGLSEMEPKITAKNTYVAPYVNGEETEYLIIEDDFPNGRPALDDAGILFTTRETVNAVETMKVTTCLNPLHTALAIFGCLLGYTSIHEEMKDDLLVSLIKQLGYQEGLPVVKHPKIIDPKAFIDEVINVRLPNPYIPDTPQRIATDTSQKIAVRFGETLKAYEAAGISIQNLIAIPFVLAGWLRYLTGINDLGEKFERSPDPLMDILAPKFMNFQFGEQVQTQELKLLMKDKEIFGVDLFEVGLAEKVWNAYQVLSSQPGAVRQALNQFK